MKHYIRLLPAVVAMVGARLVVSPRSHGKSLLKKTVLKKGSRYFPGVMGEPLVNPWAASTDMRVLDELNPTAPMDRVDRSTMTSISGNAPLGPGETGIAMPEGQAVFEGVKPDLVPPFQHPNTFPWEDSNGLASPSVDIPIGDREIVAKADRLRPITRFENNPAVNYPLVAPEDRIRPGPSPVASEDRIAHKYGKYFDQLYHNEAERLRQAEIAGTFKATDTDNDNSVSPEEFKAVIEGHQNKTGDEAGKLWGKFHTSPSQDMNKDEFSDLAKTGFDLGKLTSRKDVVATLGLSPSTNKGFWGGAVACNNGSYVNSASIVTVPYSSDPKFDNTAVNGIVLKCDDGNAVQSMGTGEGETSSEAKCPDGQSIYGFRVKNKPFEEGSDNTGINDMEFICRSSDLNNITRLRFNATIPGKDDPARNDAGSPVEWVKGVVGPEGGWSGDQKCESGLICGIQTRVQKKGDGVTDAEGIVDLRMYCCKAGLNCTKPCTGTNTSKFSAECQACQNKELMGKPKER